MTDELDTAALARVLSQLSGDLVLVIDAQGRILATAPGQDTPAAVGAGAWVGRHWADTVTADTRHKVAAMLQDLAATGCARRRELNHPHLDPQLNPTLSPHPTPAGSARALAFAYHAVKIGNRGWALAMGRDLSAQTALQQRLLEAQRQVEADRWES